ncbi:MAG: response regulator, partial [Oscillospiraceae bacterium]|nr:response regulator [Oscillospiraceae bacterium]
PFLNRFSHQIFLATLLFMFYMVYVYLIELINSEAKVVIGRKKRTFLPFLLSVAGVVFLPLNYVETVHGNYSRGPASMIIYASIAVYASLILHLLVKYHAVISYKKIKAIVIALMCELVTAMYQLIFPYSLVSSLGVLLLNLGFYLTVENPDAALVEQLKVETARADAANNAKTSFLANVSHEIRTPINAVLGMNELILRETGEKEIKNYASEVKRAAKSLLNIINDLLDITKIEAGKLTVIPVEYSLASLINDVHTLFELKAADKGLKFDVDIKGELPSTVIGDDIRLKQVLINILNNAIKYTNSGSVTLNIHAPQDGVIEFCVKDTGIGIKPEDLEKLYQPFQRIEEERNRNIEGTGLGLNITMKLLEQMGSRLDVQSVYGEGSSFSFIIAQPTVDSTPINKSTLFSPGAFAEKQYQVSYQAPNAKILIVDDNDMNRRVIAGLLKETKMQTFEAESGEDCLKITSEQRFDVILMDHMMPEMDGIQTLKAMRARENDPCRDTPIVIVTANAIVGAKEAYLEAGFTDFLSKPI